MSTIHSRLKLGRELLKKSQADFFHVLGLSQGAYSKRESGITAITIKELELLEENFGLSKVWVLTGDGPELIGSTKSQRSSELLSFTTTGLRARFQECIRDYQERKKINRKQIAEELHIGETYLSKLMNSEKEVTVQVLIDVQRYGNFNLNYIAGAVGGFYVGENNYSEQKRIQDLEQQVQNLQQLVSLQSEKLGNNIEAKKERA